MMSEKSCQGLGASNMIEKTGQVVIGQTKCCACSNTSTRLVNGHAACDECADAVGKYMGEKKAAAETPEVMFPKR